MKKGNPLNVLLLIWITVVLLVLGCGACFSSCTLTKKLKSSSKDSTVVNKVDSGSVKKNEVTTKTDSEWWREVLNFQGRDTIINNTTTPVYNYPVQIIREGGTQKVEEIKVNYDSLWNNKIDSLVHKISNVDKSAKTQFLSQFQIWAIIGLLGIVAIKHLLK